MLSSNGRFSFLTRPLIFSLHVFAASFKLFCTLLLSAAAGFLPFAITIAAIPIAASPARASASFFLPSFWGSFETVVAVLGFVYMLLKRIFCAFVADEIFIDVIFISLY